MQFNKKIAYRLNTYFKTRVGMFDYRRGWMKGDCPFCGKNQKFGVNLSSGRTFCFVCEYKRSPFNAMMEIERFSTKTAAMKFLMDFDEREVIEPIYEKYEEKDAVLPEGYKLILFGDNFHAKAARSYLKKRGFDLNELALSGWGFSSRGKYAGHIIMPFYSGGELFYFNARRYMGDGPKHNNPTTEMFGIGKSLIIYNVDALSAYKKVYIVESVMNAATLGDQAVSLGGKSISGYQRSIIIKSDIEEAVIILDSDANAQAVKQACDLAMHKRVKIVFMPEGEDVNDIGKKATMKRVHKHRWLTYNDILKLKLQYA